MEQFLKRIKNTLGMLRKEAALADIGFLTMLWRTSFFCLRTGLGPRYYVAAGMARETFPKADQWLHISATEYRKALDILNPAAYRKLTQNKLCEKAIYNVMHIPTARMRGYYHPRKGISDYGQPLQNEEQLESLLGLLKDQEICLTPVEGWNSRGMIVGRVGIQQSSAVLEQTGSGNILDARAIIDLYRSLGESPEFIIEDRLRQSNQFMDFNPDSLNTLRLWVLNGTDNKISVLGGYLKVGRAKSATDNASAGDLVCPIDIESGTLRSGTTRHSPHREELSVHPDHGAPLSGEIIEEWRELCNFACKVLDRLPHTRFASLDIGMTPTGPVLLETNPEPDNDAAAHANIPSIRLKEATVALAK